MKFHTYFATIFIIHQRRGTNLRHAVRHKSGNYDAIQPRNHPPPIARMLAHKRNRKWGQMRTEENGNRRERSAKKKDRRNVKRGFDHRRVGKIGMLGKEKVGSRIRAENFRHTRCNSSAA